jgi:hypothetical protein
VLAKMKRDEARPPLTPLEYLRFQRFGIFKQLSVDCNAEMWGYIDRTLDAITNCPDKD